MEGLTLLRQLCGAHAPEMIAWRRHLHSCPELSFEEYETADFLAEQLAAMGYTLRRNIGGTGVLATLDTGRPGPVIAFRADMDALPIREATGLPFASLRDGVMHACGHDCHMATLLGTARVLWALRDKLCGSIKLIFQPGEEDSGGASGVIGDGVLEQPAVEAVFALHVMPDLPVGTVGIRPHHMTAIGDEVVLRIGGCSAHSSAPQEGVNALTVAAQVILALQSIQASCISPFEVATFSLCKIRGGETNNIIPDFVEMEGMLRCLERETRRLFRARVEQIAGDVARTYGGTAEVLFHDGFPACVNDPRLTERVAAAAGAVLGDGGRIRHLPRPYMCAEDFSYFQEAVPGVLFFLGCGGGAGERGALHTPELNVDEACLQTGAAVFGAIALDICGRLP